MATLAKQRGRKPILTGKALSVHSGSPCQAAAPFGVILYDPEESIGAGFRVTLTTEEAAELARLVARLYPAAVASGLSEAEREAMRHAFGYVPARPAL